MKLSEFALNEAKIRGKNQYYVFEKEDYNAFLRKRRLIHLMRQAVNHDFEGFEAYFQPIMDVRGQGSLYGAETLLRFQTEETGPVSPVEFVPLLEESGLIIPVGKWVLRQAMAACRKIQQTIPDFRISVNLSYIQIMKSNVLAEIMEGIAEYDLRPDTIKIDRSFTLKALQSQYDYNLLKHMVDMSHDIELKLCIEGIETIEELAKISEIDPDFIQGYYFGKPCSLQQFCAQHLK